MSENIVVYGVRCVWWDFINNAGVLKDSGLPCCPHCGSVLFQMDESEWWQGVDNYESAGRPGYRKFVEWLHGKCFPTLFAAKQAYKAANPDLPTETVAWLDRGKD